jgi:hypothetical protein
VSVRIIHKQRQSVANAKPGTPEQRRLDPTDERGDTVVAELVGLEQTVGKQREAAVQGRQQELGHLSG